MSTGYGWEGLRRVCATLLGARHVPERFWLRLCASWGAITNVWLLTFTFYTLPTSFMAESCTC